VVEPEVVASVDLVVLPPLLGGAVAAGVEEAMEDGEEDGPLDGELEPPALQELADDVPAAGGLPEPLEDQGRADVADRDEGLTSNLEEKLSNTWQVCEGAYPCDRALITAASLFSKSLVRFLKS